MRAPAQRGRGLGRCDPLVALFAPEGEIVFHGVPVPTVRGHAAIEDFFRRQRQDDRLVLGPVVEGPRALRSTAGAAPGYLGGTVRIAMTGELIGRLDVIVLRDGPKPPAPRQAARALLVSPAKRVLLLRCTEPATRATWWITPGGGLEPGETEEQAMRRELLEEVGLEAEPSAWHRVWTREHVFTWGQNAVRQRETYFLLPSDREFTPAPALSSDRLAAGDWIAASLVEPRGRCATDVCLRPASPTCSRPCCATGPPTHPSTWGFDPAREALRCRHGQRQPTSRVRLRGSERHSGARGRTRAGRA
jgi:8-oxo-dGTP pyrophosphatase MutT (NUDIX family)